MTPAGQKINRWHSQNIEDVLNLCDTTPEGLTEEEAKARLTKYGPNRFPRQPATTPFQIFLRQFRSPLIFILALAAVVSLAIKEYNDAIFIAVVLIINATIGGFQEWKAEKSNRALEKFLKISASVIRGREVREVEAEEVVPGDVILLEPGLRVPADVRLLQERGLEIDESALTGESLPVEKRADWVGKPSTPVADRKNMAQAGTTVARGRGKGVAVATGTATTIGQLALDVLASRGGKPPLLLRLEKFTHVVGLTVVLSVIAVAVIGLIHGYALTEMFFFAVALGVAAVPEGLLVAVTVALAIATNRMAARGVIVRQLAVVEGLGSCTLIASDKTGTLTLNELTVCEISLPGGDRLQVTGKGFVPEGEVLRDHHPVFGGMDPNLDNLFRAAVLCNEGDLHRRNHQWIWRGDPTDIALLSLGKKQGWSRENLLDQYPQINEIPFESERQFSATYHAFGNHTLVFVKGAPERVLRMCDSPEGTANQEKMLEKAKQMAGQGYRVLALAEGVLAHKMDPKQTPREPSQLKFLGLVGMIDPLRPGARSSVLACQEAGVKVSMVTGDHPLTALAIAKDLGLARSMEQVVTGQDLQGKSEEELKETVARARVFSRVIPHDKLRIVHAAQANHEFVAVTGDGVNDAPALRAANIGVAMGKGGTDVARDASDIVISDDNFSTIVSGVEEGRVAYGNVRNVIYLLITQGAAEVLVVALGMAFGLPLPLLPVQLLWLNLVTNGIQDVALAFEPGLGDELKRPPRPPKESIFNRLMVERTLIGAGIIGVVGFVAYHWMISHGWDISAARNGLLLLMVLFENVHLGNCRSETKSAFALSPFRSPMLLLGALGALSLHIAFMYLPIGQKILRTQPLDLPSFGIFLALALSVTVGMEMHKWSWDLRHKEKR